MGITIGQLSSDIHFQSSKAMIYELRQYTPNPGKEALMKARFAMTLPLFRKHGLLLESSFNPVDSQNQLWYLLRFESNSAREIAWAAFLADPQWHELKRQSEVEGPVLLELKKSLLERNVA